MKKFLHPKFEKSPAVVCAIVCDRLETDPIVTVNGTSFTFPTNEAFETHQVFADNLSNSGHNVEFAPAVGDGEAEAAGDAEQAPSGNTFDAASVLDQSVKEVEAYIAGNTLNAEDLAALLKSEEDGKKRSSLIKAIKAAQSA